jgi:hypothetical protein
MSISRSSDDGGSAAVPPTGLTPSPPWFPLLGMTVRRLGRLVDELPGGRQSLAGLEIFKVRRGVLKAPSDVLSICERLQAEGDAGIGIATWFVCFNSGDVFLDFLEALEFFFAGLPQGIDTVIWLSCVSRRCVRDAELHLFKHVIEGTRNMVMFMSSWDKPNVLTRAWCLWELYICCSCGGRIEFALPRAQRAQSPEVIGPKLATFMHSIVDVSIKNGTCFLASDQDDLFDAIATDAGFSVFDAIVQRTLKEYAERLLRGSVQMETIA